MTSVSGNRCCSLCGYVETEEERAKGLIAHRVENDGVSAFCRASYDASLWTPAEAP